MTKRSAFGILLLVLPAVIACSGCQANTPTTPTLQSQPRPVSGTVLNLAGRGLGGVIIEAIDGLAAGTSTMTNAAGAFSLPGVFDPAVTFRASKDGYLASTLTAASTSAGRSGVLWFRLALAGPVDVAGEYTLTLVADPACGTWTRTYEATISPSQHPNHPPGTNFVTLNGDSLRPSYGTFTIVAVGDRVTFGVSYSHHPAVVEQVAQNKYLAIEGEARSIFDSEASSPVSTQFQGYFESCELTSEMDSEYYCPAAEAVAKTRCESTNHRLVLTRR